MKIDLEGDLIKEFKNGWNKRMQWLRTVGFVFGGLFVLLGVLFLFSPLKIAAALKYIVATAVMCLGVVRCFEYFMAPPLFRSSEKLISGIFSALIGALLLQMSIESALTLFSLIIGVYLLASGITKLGRSAQLHAIGIKNCNWLIIDGVFRVVVAFLFFAMPAMSVAVLNVVIGLYLLIDGLSIIVEASDTKALEIKNRNKRAGKQSSKKADDAKEAEIVKKK